jgi:hypothetical protein
LNYQYEIRKAQDYDSIFTIDYFDKNVIIYPSWKLTFDNETCKYNRMPEPDVNERFIITGYPEDLSLMKMIFENACIQIRNLEMSHKQMAINEI